MIIVIIELVAALIKGIIYVVEKYNLGDKNSPNNTIGPGDNNHGNHYDSTHSK